MAVRALPELRTDRISVCVATADPLSRAGTIAQLRGAGGIVLVDEEELDERAVALVVAHTRAHDPNRKDDRHDRPAALGGRLALATQRTGLRPARGDCVWPLVGRRRGERL